MHKPGPGKNRLGVEGWIHGLATVDSERFVSSRGPGPKLATALLPPAERGKIRKLGTVTYYWVVPIYFHRVLRRLPDRGYSSSAGRISLRVSS